MFNFWFTSSIWDVVAMVMLWGDDKDPELYPCANCKSKHVRARLTQNDIQNFKQKLKSTLKCKRCKE